MRTNDTACGVILAYKARKMTDYQQVTLAEWLTRCPAIRKKASLGSSLGSTGSNPVGDDSFSFFSSVFAFLHVLVHDESVIPSLGGFLILSCSANNDMLSGL